MIDWTQSMRQRFEYYTVDPDTWKDVRKLENVKSCTINRDLEAETLGSATIDVTESIGECYVRVYLIAIQNGVEEKVPLGTFLVQSPASSFDGRVKAISMDAYTPLIELKEKNPPIGYSLLKGDNTMERAYQIVRENLRAPVVEPNSSVKLFNDFVADPSETWISYVIDLVANAKYEIGLDELGRVIFNAKQDTASLRPVWTYTDNNSSILYPEVSMNHDLYGIPNVVEVVYSSGADCYFARAVNNDSDSPISTVSRGREIVHRISNPDLGNPTENQIEAYAEQCLRDLSSLEYSISYTHGYCPVRLGDSVRLDYKRAEIVDVTGKVVSQSIKCEPGCPVTEKIVYTKKLWR